MPGAGLADLAHLRPKLGRLRTRSPSDRHGLPLTHMRHAAMSRVASARAATRCRTSVSYAELGANLCQQVFQHVHLSFETRDVGLHRRELRDTEGWSLSR